MKELLPLLSHPATFAGAEEGRVFKDTSRVALHVALAYPDSYEVGMSYLGQKILYDIGNNEPEWWIERVFEPDPDSARVIRENGARLSTLESDTPLCELDAVGFSITHELCFTDVLHMLDLGGIPLRSSERSENLAEDPVVLAGGGAMFGAEPLAPFIDLASLGDGEESFPEILRLLQRAKAEGWARSQLLQEAAKIPGVYVPSFFVEREGVLTSTIAEYRPVRRIVADLDEAHYPVKQVLPVSAVHERVALEIARGCTRGCRFCHAGVVYRPVRERSLSTLAELLEKCINDNGFEEVSFLSLSTGDYSALKALWGQSFQRCAQEQVTLSLPSLRVGSVDEEIMEKMATLRRTGITIAPEAGSQRLRNVINKGITEEEILEHVKMLASHGWRHVKLYFMIGLPTETDEDLEAIHQLCQRVLAAGRPASLQVSAAISTFVPKPFTPFQWEKQIGLEETKRRIDLLRTLFRGSKGLKLRWHEPEISFVEGVFSRGDRKLAKVVECAYRKGAIFSAWTDRFQLEPWLAAFAECGVDPDSYLAERGDLPLPWDHLECGVSKAFLRREREKALQEKTTPDCRYNACSACGACDQAKAKSRLVTGSGARITRRLVNAVRDQEGTSSHQPVGSTPARPTLAGFLTNKAAQYRVWHRKLGGQAWLSPLELQAAVERALRRSGLPLAFSQGYHPLPLISFGRALTVGVESEAEWFAITLAERIEPGEILHKLNPVMAEDLAAWSVEFADSATRTAQSEMEKFLLAFPADDDIKVHALKFVDFFEKPVFPFWKKGKNGIREVDVRPNLHSWKICVDKEKSVIEFIADWRGGYLSPALLVNAILGRDGNRLVNASLLKISQIFANGRVCELSS